jgi:hypothetical protein
MITVAVRAPAAVGVKVIKSEHEVVGANVSGQLLVR